MSDAYMALTSGGKIDITVLQLTAPITNSLVPYLFANNNDMLSFEDAGVT